MSSGPPLSPERACWNLRTEGQTAEVLGVSRITVWRWIEDGKFDIQRVGREVLTRKWEVELLKGERQE